MLSLLSCERSKLNCKKNSYASTDVTQPVLKNSEANRKVNAKKL